MLTEKSFEEWKNNHITKMFFATLKKQRKQLEYCMCADVVQANVFDISSFIKLHSITLARRGQLLALRDVMEVSFKEVEGTPNE